jgi:hypothetical protein
MKFVILVTALLATSTLFAETRKPASLGNEILQSYLRTADLLSQARSENLTCDVGSYQSEIINTLKKAKSSESFDGKMITQNMKSALAGTIALKEFTGEVNLDYNASASTYEKALTNTYFEGLAAGVYGPSETFILKSGGVIEYTRTEYLEDEPFTKPIKTLGKWGVKTDKNNLVRVWFTVGKKTRAYRLERSYDGHDTGWYLKSKEKPSDTNGQRVQFYNGKMSECEA